MKKCYNCRQPNYTVEMLCDDCLPMGITRFPGVHGVSDGPGSCINEMIFDRPDPKKDIELTCKRMESDGTFVRKPELKEFAKIKMDAAKKMSHSNTDYQKQGHPLA